MRIRRSKNNNRYFTVIPKIEEVNEDEKNKLHNTRIGHDNDNNLMQRRRKKAND